MDHPYIYSNSINRPTSLNGPFKVGPIVGRFREVLEYCLGPITPPLLETIAVLFQWKIVPIPFLYFYVETSCYALSWKPIASTCHPLLYTAPQYGLHT